MPLYAPVLLPLRWLIEWARSATEGAPVAADTQASTGIPIPQQVEDLAATLGNATAAFNYVHDNIRTDLYHGARRGPLGTMFERRGNDVDQATLLVALLRALGIPARLETGPMEVDAAQLLSWAGMTERPDDSTATRNQIRTIAGNVIGSAGYEGSVFVRFSDGEVVGAKFDQTWVAAYVPLSNYRGHGDPAGPSKMGWIRMSPHL